MLISKFLFLIRAREECVDLFAEVDEGVEAEVGEGLRVELSVGE